MIHFPLLRTRRLTVQLRELSIDESIALARFFDGKPFADWKKAREAELKMQAAIVERLNGVIRACGVVVKAIAKTR